MSVTHCVHVQGVHTQVKGCQVHALEHLHQRLTLASFHMHNILWILLHGPFDETQKVLLVHAGRSVNVCVDLQNIPDKQDRKLHPGVWLWITINLSD